MAVIIEINIESIDFIRAFIEKIIKGQIKTWKVDSDCDITISNPLWQNRAWFGIYYSDNSNEIGFGIIPANTIRLTKELYGVYHGRLVATLLANFDKHIESLKVTPRLYPEYDKLQSEEQKTPAHPI